MQSRPRQQENVIGVGSIDADGMQEAVLAERARCVSILRDRAKQFDRRKLFQLARPLAAIADEIAASELKRPRRH